MKWITVLVIANVVVVVCGCGGPLYRNQPLQRYAPSEGYRFESLTPGPGNTDSVFVVVSLSGGGTRAASFAYGVLKGLYDTPIKGVAPADGPRRLLDEVDIISSVSGGSFTAVGYGLWRDALFAGEFERRVLKHNIQLDLLLTIWQPRNLIRLPFVLLDRIDLAATYYSERLFEEHTYADLLARKHRPFIVVNATDISRRQRFEFTQDDFDLLGSDLSQLPVGWAVAASSAFPLVLSPLRLKYFAGPPLSTAVAHVLAKPEGQVARRRRRWADSLSKAAWQAGCCAPVIDERKHRYLYLLDGGLSDNLGVTHFIESYRYGAIRNMIDNGRIDKLVVIIVDAGTAPPTGLEAQASAPTLLTVGIETGVTGMYNHSATLTETVKYVLLEALPETRRVYEECKDALAANCPSATPPMPRGDHDMEAYVLDLNFRRIKDPTRRNSLLSMLTNFFLPRRDVQLLIDAGQEVLTQHPEFQRLVNDLN